MCWLELKHLSCYHEDEARSWGRGELERAWALTRPVQDCLLPDYDKERNLYLVKVTSLGPWLYAADSYLNGYTILIWT